MSLEPESGAAIPPSSKRFSLFRSKRRKGWAGALAVVIVLVGAAAAVALFRGHDQGEGFGEFTLLGTFHNGTRGIFSPDGKTFAIATDHHVRLGYFSGGTRERELPLPAKNSEVGDMAFSPDGRFFVATDNGGGNGNKIRVWDVKTGAVRWTVEHSRVSDLAFSPDGKMLATSGSVDIAFGSGVTRANGSSGKGVRVWKVATRKLRAAFGADSTVSDVAFSPDGKLLAVKGNTATVWNLATASPDKTFSFNARQEAAPSGRHSARFSADGKYILTVDEVYENGRKTKEGATVSLWNRGTGKYMYSMTGDYAEFSPDGRYIAAVNDPEGSGDGTLTVWETATGKKMYTVEEDGAHFSVDGRFVATYGGGIESSEICVVVLRSLRDGREIKSYGGEGRVQFSPDSRYFFTVTLGDHPEWEDEVTLRSLPDGNQVHVFEHTATAQFSRNGRMLATFSEDSTRVWTRR